MELFELKNCIDVIIYTNALGKSSNWEFDPFKNAPEHNEEMYKDIYSLQRRSHISTLKKAITEFNSANGIDEAIVSIASLYLQDKYNSQVNEEDLKELSSEQFLKEYFKQKSLSMENRFNRLCDIIMSSSSEDCTSLTEFF